jgi:hypothetical protein
MPPGRDPDLVVEADEVALAGVSHGLAVAGLGVVDYFALESAGAPGKRFAVVDVLARRLRRRGLARKQEEDGCHHRD